MCGVDGSEVCLLRIIGREGGGWVGVRCAC